MNHLQRSVAALAGVAVLATSALTFFPAQVSAAGLPAPLPGAEVHPRPLDGDYDLVGGGFGHGIGMSQYGAQGAALAGKTYQGILAFYYPGTTLEDRAPTTIRIGITSDNDGVVRVGATPGLSIQVGSTTTTLPTAPSQWRVRATDETAQGCRVESYDGSTWSAYRAGATPCPVRFSSSTSTVDLFLPTGERRVYRGAITAHHRGSTSLATVNTVATQLYLRGVVPSEMPPSWHAEALKAQTVAARTYASRRANGTSYYDTCDTTSCQVYRGSGRRNADGSITSYEYPSTNSAIAATDRKVLRFAFGDGVTRLATTMYSSSNGGYTAAAGNGHDYLSSYRDPYDKVSSNSRHRWSATLPVASLEARFGIHRVQRVQIVTRDGRGSWGGRVLKVRVEGLTSAGQYTYVDTTGNGLQAARPWPRYASGLSSNYFTILPAGTVTRVATGSAYTIAATFSKNWPTGVDVVYVANGGATSYQLVAAARAAYNGGPLLLTQGASLPSVTTEAMKRLKPRRVVVIGGTNVVSSGVAESLRRLTTSGTLTRVGGADTYATAAALSRYWAAGQRVTYVAAGDSSGDAAAGAALAGRDRAPILLTRKGYLPAATTAELKRLAPDRIVILGGTGSVSNDVAVALRAYARSGTVSRLGGSDRYASAAAVAAQYTSATKAYVTSGQVPHHAYTAAALAGANGVPVLLTTQSAVPTSILRHVERLRPARVEVLGSTTYVSEGVLTQLRQAVS